MSSIAIAGGGGGRTVLTADTTFYYATTGSDVTGNGTVGNPFATPQHTWDIIASTIDANGFQITMQGANGTYRGVLFSSFPPNGTFFNIVGNIVDRTKVVWQDRVLAGGGNCFDINAITNAFFMPAGMTFDANTAGCNGIRMGAMGEMFTDFNGSQIGFTASGGSGGSCYKILGPLSAVRAFADEFVSGTWDSYCYLGQSGCVYDGLQSNLTLVSIPSFSTFLISFGGYFEFDGTINGTATGDGVQLFENSVAHFNTTNNIPGTTPGHRISGDLSFSGLNHGGLIATYARNGAPTTTDVTDGGSGTFLDTGTGIYSLTLNDSGNLRSVAKGLKSSNIVGNGAIATNATDGFLYIPTCAGTPTGTPTTVTGFVPLVFDTTNSQFWIYTSGAWKQPKTVGTLVTVDWQ